MVCLVTCSGDPPFLGITVDPVEYRSGQNRWSSCHFSRHA